MSGKHNNKHSKLANENIIQSFSKIVDFIEQLKEVFCVDDKFHEIELYNHLLSKIKLTNKNSIEIHVKLFTDFCKRNSDAILKKDLSLLVNTKILFNEKVYLDITKILLNTDKDTTETIWNHLLVIHAATNPSYEVFNIVEKLKSDGTKEGEFLNNFLGKIENSIDKTASKTDPMSVASNILQSGVLTDMIGSIDKGVKNGSLDIGKLMGTMQSVLTGLTGNQTNNREIGGQLAGLDIGNIMSMFMGGGGLRGMMGSNPGFNQDSMKVQIEQKVAEEMKKLNISDLTNTSHVLALPNVTATATTTAAASSSDSAVSTAVTNSTSVEIKPDVPTENKSSE